MLTELVILGVLNRARRHGYDIKKEIEFEMQNVDVRFGSIYHALKKFTEKGLIQKVEIPPSEEGRPDRTGYEITDKGKEYLESLLREAISTPYIKGDALDAGLHFLGLLTTEETVTLLQERLEHLNIRQQELQEKQSVRPEEILERNRARKPSYLSDEEEQFWQQDQQYIPEMVALAMDRQVRHLNAEIRWIEDTLDRLQG